MILHPGRRESAGHIRVRVRRLSRVPPDLSAGSLVGGRLGVGPPDWRQVRSEGAAPAAHAASLRLASSCPGTSSSSPGTRQVPDVPSLEAAGTNSRALHVAGPRAAGAGGESLAFPAGV